MHLGTLEFRLLDTDEKTWSIAQYHFKGVDYLRTKKCLELLWDTRSKTIDQS